MRSKKFAYLLLRIWSIGNHFLKKNYKASWPLIKLLSGNMNSMRKSESIWLLISWKLILVEWIKNKEISVYRIIWNLLNPFSYPIGKSETVSEYPFGTVRNLQIGSSIRNFESNRWINISDFLPLIGTDTCECGGGCLEGMGKVRKCPPINCHE